MDEVAVSTRPFRLARARWWIAGLVVVAIIAGGVSTINARTSSPELDRAEVALEAVKRDIRAKMVESQGESCVGQLVAGGITLLEWDRTGEVIRITGSYYVGPELEALLEHRLAEHRVPRSLVITDEREMTFGDVVCNLRSSE